MIFNINKFDIEWLRKNLIECFISAMFMISTIVLNDLTKVENANETELINISLNNKIDLKKYFQLAFY